MNQPHTLLQNRTPSEENSTEAEYKENEYLHFPDYPMLSRIPYISCDTFPMASWRDVKEIIFPECSGADCTIVENALKLKLQYPRNEDDIRVCSAKEQLEFLELLHIVMPGTLLVNLQTLSQHMQDLIMMVATKHHVSQDARSTECLYAKNKMKQRTKNKIPIPKSYTVTLIHFPVLKIPTLGNSDEESANQTFFKTCMSGEPCIDSLVSNCVPMQAILTVKSEEMIHSQQNDSVTVPQHFIPLRFILDLYPMLQMQLMKISADFMYQLTTEVMLRFCTVEEAHDLSADLSRKHLTSSDILVQWSDPFYLMSCLRNKHLKSIKEEPIDDSKKSCEEKVNSDQSNTCLTSSDSFCESRINSVSSDCSESLYAYDADIEESVDQSNAEEGSHVSYYPIKMNVTTQIHWGNKRKMDNKIRPVKSFTTSLADQNEIVDVQEEQLFMRLKRKMGMMNIGAQKDLELDLTPKVVMSDDSMKVNVASTNSQSGSHHIYDPNDIAFQLLEEEEKLNTVDPASNIVNCSDERSESPVTDDIKTEPGNENNQCQKVEGANIETVMCNEKAGEVIVENILDESQKHSSEIIKPMFNEFRIQSRSLVTENEDFCDQTKEKSPSGTQSDFRKEISLDNTSIQSDFKKEPLLENVLPQYTFRKETSLNNVSLQSTFRKETSLNNVSLQSTFRKETSLNNVSLQSDIKKETSLENVSLQSDIRKETSLENVSLQSTFRKETSLNNVTLQSDIKKETSLDNNSPPSQTEASVITEKSHNASSALQKQLSPEGVSDEQDKILSTNTKSVRSLRSSHSSSEAKQKPLPPLSSSEAKQKLLSSSHGSCEAKQKPLPPLSSSEAKQKPLSSSHSSSETKQKPLPPLSSSDAKQKPLSSSHSYSEAKQKPLPPLSSSEAKQKLLSSSHSSSKAKKKPLSSSHSSSEAKQKPLLPSSYSEAKQKPLSSFDSFFEAKQKPLLPSCSSEAKQKPLSSSHSSSEAKQKPHSPSSSSEATQKPLSPSSSSKGKQKPLPPPNSNSALDDHRQSSSENNPSGSENTPLRRGHSTPHGAAVALRNKIEKRGANWHSDTKVSKLYTVLTAPQVAQRSAEMVAIELAGGETMISPLNSSIKSFSQIISPSVRLTSANATKNSSPTDGLSESNTEGNVSRLDVEIGEENIKKKTQAITPQESDRTSLQSSSTEKLPECQTEASNPEENIKKTQAITPQESDRTSLQSSSTEKLPECQTEASNPEENIKKKTQAITPQESNRTSLQSSSTEKLPECQTESSNPDVRQWFNKLATLKLTGTQPFPFGAPSSMANFGETSAMSEAELHVYQSFKHSGKRSLPTSTISYVTRSEKSKSFSCFGTTTRQMIKHTGRTSMETGSNSNMSSSEGKESPSKKSFLQKTVKDTEPISKSPLYKNPLVSKEESSPQPTLNCRTSMQMTSYTELSPQKTLKVTARKPMQTMVISESGRKTVPSRTNSELSISEAQSGRLTTKTGGMSMQTRLASKLSKSERPLHPSESSPKQAPQQIGRKCVPTRPSLTLSKSVNKPCSQESVKTTSHAARHAVHTSSKSTHKHVTSSDVNSASRETAETSQSSAETSQSTAETSQSTTKQISKTVLPNTASSIVPKSDGQISDEVRSNSQDNLEKISSSNSHHDGDGSSSCDVSKSLQASSSCDVSKSLQASSSCDVSKSLQASSSCDVPKSLQASSSCDVPKSLQASSSCDVSKSLQALSSCDVSKSLQASSSCDVSKSLQASSSCDVPKSLQASSSCDVPKSLQASSSCDVSKSLQASSSCDVSKSLQASSLCDVSKSLQAECQRPCNSIKEKEQTKSCEEMLTDSVDSKMMDHMFSIFHSFLQDEIQFAVESQMQNELNEKLNDVYNRKNQDDNTIVSCRSSKYSDIWKHKVDKVCNGNYKKFNNVQQNSSKIVNNPSKKIKETSEKSSSMKQVVTPLKISKLQKDNHSKTCTNWTVEKIQKIPGSKKEVSNLVKDMSLKDQSNENDGHKLKEPKYGFQVEGKTCGIGTVSKSTGKGKHVSDSKSSSYSKSLRVTEKASSNLKENCTNFFNLNTKRSQEKQANNSDIRLGTQAKKKTYTFHSKSGNDQNNKVERSDFHSNSDCTNNRIKEQKNDLNTECVKTKLNNDLRFNYSHSDKSKTTDTTQRNSYKNSTNGLQQQKQNGVLQLNNEDFINTGQIQNFSLPCTEQDLNVDKHLLNKPANCQPCASSPVVQDDDQRKVYSQEMLNEMVSSNPFAQSVESLKSLNNCRVIKEIEHDKNEQSKSYPGEIEIVSKILSKSIPEKKRINSPPLYSRNGVGESTDVGRTHNMAVPTEYVAPHSVIMPIDNSIRYGTAVPRNPYPRVIANEALNHQSGNSICYGTIVPSFANDYISPQFAGNNFLNMCAPPGASIPAPPGASIPAPPGASLPAPPCASLPLPPGASLPAPPCASLPLPPGASLPAPLGRDMQHKTVSFSSPLTYGTQQSVLGSSLFNQLCISNDDQMSNTYFTPHADDSSGVTYTVSNNYWHPSSFRNTVGDNTGEPSFFISDPQNMSCKSASETKLPVNNVNTEPATHVARSLDSYTGNLSQGYNQQKQAQYINELFGETSKSADGLGLNHNVLPEINVTVKKRFAPIEKRTYGSWCRASNDWLTRNLSILGNECLGTSNTKRNTKSAIPASRASGKDSYLQAGLEQQDDPSSENVSNGYQHHSSSSKRMTNKSKTVHHTNGKNDINNNCRLEESRNSCQRVDDLCNKSSNGYPVQGSLVKNKPIKKNILERQVLQTDIDHAKKTACTCRATIHSRPGQDESLKKHLKMKFSLSSKHCPVHSNEKRWLYRHDMMNQVEIPPTSKQNQIKIDSLGERVKTTKQTENAALPEQNESEQDSVGERVKTHKQQRRFKTVKDRILESVKHLQQTNEADQQGNKQTDNTQAGGSLLFDSSGVNFDHQLNKCSDGNPDVVISEVNNEKGKQRKRSKRPFKLRRNQIESHRKMLQRTEPMSGLSESETADQDLFLESVVGAQTCKGQEQFAEHDLRFCDIAEAKAQSSKGQGQFNECDGQISEEDKAQVCVGDTIDCKDIEKDYDGRTMDELDGTLYYSECDSPESDDSVFVTMSAHVNKVNSRNIEKDGHTLVTRSDNHYKIDSNNDADGKTLWKRSSSQHKVDSSNRDVNGKILLTVSDNVSQIGSQRKDVKTNNEIRYRAIIVDEMDMSLCGLVMYKNFVFPYVTNNGFKYIPMKDGTEMFERCCPECSIPRSVMRKDFNLCRTLCNWEQICMFDEMGMSATHPVATGDILLRFDRLVQEMPRLEKVAREKHVGTKLKKSQHCRY